jgi:hypothetical protein
VSDWPSGTKYISMGTYITTIHVIFPHVQFQIFPCIINTQAHEGGKEEINEYRKEKGKKVKKEKENMKEE